MNSRYAAKKITRRNRKGVKLPPPPLLVPAVLPVLAADSALATALSKLACTRPPSRLMDSWWRSVRPAGASVYVAAPQGMLKGSLRGGRQFSAVRGVHFQVE